MTKAIIMVGLPGSGKSTVANKIAALYESSKIHSTDDFHMKDGKYVFQPHKLGHFHKENQQAFEDSLKAGIEVVICDNTNLTKWERQPYLEMAQKYGYTVQLLVVGDFDMVSARKYQNRNVHGVPLEAYTRMIEKYEIPCLLEEEQDNMKK